MSIGIIYKVVNLNNNKIYIGQTFRSFTLRKYEHLRKSKSGEYNSTFAKALRKYPEEDFQWSIIDEASTQIELDSKEIFWIDFYNSHRDNNCGYNGTIGGGGTRGFLMSKETRLKMSNSRKGKLHTEETKISISLGLKGKMSGEKHPMFGKKFSVERREKISKALRGRVHTEESKRKMSIGHTGKKLSIEHIEKISLRTSGNKNPMWNVKHKEETKLKIGLANKGKLSGDKNPSAKIIVKLTKEGKFTERFTTGLEGAKSVSGDLSAIIKCCKGKQKTAYGFKWMYEEDYLKL